MDSAIAVLRRIRAPLEESREMLEGVVRDLRMTALAQVMFVACPEAEPACRLLVWLVTPALLDPISSTGVAHLCVRRILTGLSRPAHGVLDMAEVLASNLREGIAEYLVTLEVSLSGRRWNPAADLPLLAWCAGAMTALQVSVDSSMQGRVRRALAEGVVTRILGCAGHSPAAA